MTLDDHEARMRAAFLTDLAWAGGDPALQRGWWPYIAAELDKLGEQFKAEALAALQKRRDAA